VAVDDHTQGAIEVVVLLGTQVVELLEGEGLVAGEQSVSVTLELDNTVGTSPNFL
jgi:hypothetical protein